MDTNEIIQNIRQQQRERFVKRYFPEEKEGPSSSPYVPVSFALIDNPDFRNGLMAKPRFRTYLFLRRRVIRGSLPKDRIDVFENYWISGELAVSMTLEKLSERLQLPKSSVGDHIRQLEQDKVIVVDKIPAARAWDNREHQVFILGTCHEGKERWFLDEVFGAAAKTDCKTGSAEGFKHQPVRSVRTP